MIYSKNSLVLVVLFILFTFPTLANDPMKGLFESAGFIPFVKENPILSNYANIDCYELYRTLDSLQYSEKTANKMMTEFGNLSLAKQAEKMGFTFYYELVLAGRKSADELSLLIKAHYKDKIFMHNATAKRFKQRILNFTQGEFNDRFVKYLIDRLLTLEDSDEKWSIRRYLFYCLFRNPCELINLNENDYKENSDFIKVIDNVKKFKKGIITDDEVRSY